MKSGALIYPLKYLSSSSQKLAECLQKKKETIEQMEVKLDTGIDRWGFNRWETAAKWDVLFLIWEN